jgi:hypothetical protein
LIALQDEIAFARSSKQLKTDADPVQVAFELHAYVQEANWAFKLFNHAGNQCSQAASQEI